MSQSRCPSNRQQATEPKFTVVLELLLLEDA
jgi:hypothetical protein